MSASDRRCPQRDRQRRKNDMTKMPHRILLVSTSQASHDPDRRAGISPWRLPAAAAWASADQRGPYHGDRDRLWGAQDEHGAFILSGALSPRNPDRHVAAFAVCLGVTPTPFLYARSRTPPRAIVAA